MENQSVDELPVQVFNPRPELQLRPTTLVRVGVFVASTAVVAALNPRPEAGLFGTDYGAYGLYIALLLLFLFGMWLIILGWVAADDPDDYNAATRNAIRATQLMLVFAIGVYEFYHAN